MTDRVTIRISQELNEALDRFIATGAVPVHSRQDAFRHIVSTWLAGEGYTSPPAALQNRNATRDTPQRGGSVNLDSGLSGVSA